MENGGETENGGYTPLKVPTCVSGDIRPGIVNTHQLPDSEFIQTQYIIGSISCTRERGTIRIICRALSKKSVQR
jgi:hypothetical protein